jgi:nucleotide-binding universal stress UspA family protein
MKTIVVGYDETEPSKRALERAAELADKFGSKLIVTSVAPVLVGGPRSAGPTDPTDPPGRHLEELAHAQTFLKERNLDADFVPAVGEPAETIAELATERNADMIVVGTREPNVLQRILGQSVSDSVAHKAHCDILIVH